MDPIAWVALVACLGLLGVITGGEAALLKADGETLAAQAQGGDPRSAAALALRARGDRLRATRIVGSTLTLICGATVITSAPLYGGSSGSILLLALGVLLFLLAGYALPRRVSLRYADTLAPRLAWPITAIQQLLSPLILGYDATRRGLERLFRVDTAHVQREEIVGLLDDPSQALAPEERRLIRRVFEIGDLTVEQCMTPLVDVHALRITATIGEAVDAVLRHGTSRLPVFEGRVDNLIGVLHHRDLLHGPGDEAPIRPLIRPVRFVPESKGADELLRVMREENDPFAVVVDEYGGTVGIVSLEDLIEQFLGEIADERDQAQPAIRRLGEGEWRVPARTEIEALEQALGLTAPVGDFATVAGMLLAITGRIPEEGETIEVGPLSFTIESASERAIHTVRVYKRLETGPPSPPGSSADGLGSPKPSTSSSSKP